MKYPYIAVRMTKVKKSEYSKGKWDFGADRNLIPLAVKCITNFWKIFHTKLNTHLTHDLVHSQKKWNKSMFTKRCVQQCSHNMTNSNLEIANVSINRIMDTQIIGTYSMEYSTAIKRNKWLICNTTWTSLKICWIIEVLHKRIQIV